MRLSMVLLSLIIVGCSSAPQRSEITWKTLRPLDYTNSVKDEAIVSDVYAEAGLVETSNELETWKIRLVNNSQMDYCAKPVWQTFEFNNLTKGGWIDVMSDETVDIGYMVQKPWKYKSYDVLIPPAAILLYMEMKPSILGCDN